MNYRNDRKWAVIFLTPAILLLLAFMAGPVIASFVLSLFEWDLLTPPNWVGIANFVELFRDAEFYRSLGNTLTFIIGYVPVVIAAGLVIAVMMNQALPARTLLRTAFFIPVVSSWVAVALLWKWLFNPRYGLVNYALSLLGVSGPAWLFDPNWAMPAIIITSVWKDIGFVMMILLSGLQEIPKNYHEAAAIDGAGPVRVFFSITLPLLTSTIFFVLIISLINSFQVFDQVWVMTGGGPAGATSVLVQQIYLNAARYGQMGYASALSLVLFAIILMVTVAQMRLQKRWVHSE
ncbi:MAG: sugar ABC transporter permease [Alkalispirochaeta sp.]